LSPDFEAALLLLTRAKVPRNLPAGPPSTARDTAGTFKRVPSLKPTVENCGLTLKILPRSSGCQPTAAGFIDDCHSLAADAPPTPATSAYVAKRLMAAGNRKEKSNFSKSFAFVSPLDPQSTDKAPMETMARFLFGTRRKERCLNESKLKVFCSDGFVALHVPKMSIFAWIALNSYRPRSHIMQVIFWASRRS
jgi:hypothetical protein